MKINSAFLKQISLFSIIVGLCVGLLTLIPFIGGLVFVLYFLLISAGLIIYLKKNNVLGDITVKEGAIFGAVIGIASMFGFYGSFLPLLLVISLINANYNPLIANLVLYSFTNPLNLFTLVFLLILGALLCGLMNCFGGGVTAYIYELLANLQNEEG
ncbi:MAG: hypothetical protein K6E29_03485 [Cyanobacteria bacterium RUI128]|nr:hypothetical protein [Cyanobacteria bacterium RUI128]